MSTVTREREIGQRLRDIRESRRLSLRQVEESSNGRWKAAVVGSYERAARSPRLGQLIALTDWYGADLWDVIPTSLPAVVVSRETAMALPLSAVKAVGIPGKTIYLQILKSS